jgi:dipeptidyl aminopeptidase/acylaminoacyl peptidase
MSIISRQKIELNNSQTQMIISGWGKEIIDYTTVEKIIYESDGLKITGYIAYTNDKSKKYPCILWNRGGSKDSGFIDRFNARGIYGQIASWGYVVLASQYRGNAGSEGKEELGGRDLNDILNIIPIADEIPQADTNKWGIEGWSRGGMMTYLMLTKRADFKCAILSGAISNIKQNAEEKPAMNKIYKEIIGDKNYEKELEKRSAFCFAEKLPKIPYLLMHGTNDDTISPLQTLEMAKKFQTLGIKYKLVMFEDGDHYLRNHRKEVDSLRKNWFDKYLKI